MAIWIISGEGPKELPQTKLKQEKLLEEDLEDWIEKEPLILGVNRPGFTGDSVA